MVPRPKSSDRVDYAKQKCKEAVRQHETDVSVEPPVPKSKVIVLGNSGVGKTSIIYRHKYGTELTPYNATIGASYVNCEIGIKEHPVNLQIWDTAGQERFRCMVPMYMRNAVAAIVVYDITERKSFDDIDQWLKELERCSVGLEPTVRVLVGNKADLTDKRMVAKGEGITKAAMMGAKFYEISAYDINMIDRIFYELAEQIHARVCLAPPPQPPMFTSVLQLGRENDELPKKPRKPSSSCCTLL